jgi:hypothetical protein
VPSSYAKRTREDSGSELRAGRARPEFTSRAFDAWAYARGIKIEYIQPGKPVQNCFVESLIGSFRDECLNLHWFVSTHDARRTIERWRKDYNRVRPHSSLGDLTPEEFVKIHWVSRASPPTSARQSQNDWTKLGAHVTRARPLQQISDLTAQKSWDHTTPKGEETGDLRVGRMGVMSPTAEAKKEGKAMKRVLQFLCVTFVLAALAQPVQAQEWSAEELEVWQVISEQWELEVAGDLSWIEMLHPSFEGWPVGMPHPFDKEGVRRFVAAEADQSEILAYFLDPLAITVTGGTAVVHYNYSLITQYEDGEREMDIGRSSDVLIRTEDGWQWISWVGDERTGVEDN